MKFACNKYCLPSRDKRVKRYISSIQGFQHVVNKRYSLFFGSMDRQNIKDVGAFL